MPVDRDREREGDRHVERGREKEKDRDRDRDREREREREAEKERERQRDRIDSKKGKGKGRYRFFLVYAYRSFSFLSFMPMLHSGSALYCVTVCWYFSLSLSPPTHTHPQPRTHPSSCSLASLLALSAFTHTSVGHKVSVVRPPSYDYGASPSTPPSDYFPPSSSGGMGLGGIGGNNLPQPPSTSGGYYGAHPGVSRSPLSYSPPPLGGDVRDKGSEKHERGLVDRGGDRSPLFAYSMSFGGREASQPPLTAGPAGVSGVPFKPGFGGFPPRGQQ
mmetsp:Transcript_40126/g.104015  ORF Transcript_40126/g.104015 Transcript_40126/m.104015 type:complete len:275 (+) Transcript_40126:6550-7374(+)